jgi:hypothetical protein
VGALARVSGDGILEMVFLVEVSGHKLESSQTRVFVCFFCTLILQFYKTLFMKKLAEFSCFAAFFVRIFKTREEYLWFY